MSDTLDLESVIEDSLNDAVSGVDTDYASDTPADTPEPISVADDDGTGQVESVPQTSSQVTAPGGAAVEETPAKDPFEEAVGVPQMGVTGRENRIPYSRVKKITEKAASEAEVKIAETVLGRKLAQGEKPTDIVKQHIAQIPELNSKVQNYESRLNTVGQFENVMARDPEKFLTMLAKLPAYKQFFQFVETAYDTMQRVGQSPADPTSVAQSPGQQPQSEVPTDMPQPDEQLPDGSAVYSMKGLQNLLTWTQTNAKRQAVQEATAQFDSRYKELQNQYSPMMRAWQEHQVRQSVVPVIQAQIAEAKTWPMFTELEPEITKILEQDKTISLEAAYRRVAYPKFLAERNTMRQSIIKELQTAPTATSVSRGGAKPLTPTAGPRSMEEVIREQVESLKAGGRA